MAKVDLEFLARQMERVINDVAGLKEDVTVVLAQFDRIDATTHSLVTEVRAMHSRHERLSRGSTGSRSESTREASGRSGPIRNRAAIVST